MPSVTRIRHTRAGRVRVTLDAETELVISPATAERYHLHVGLELLEAESAALRGDALRQEALRRALRFLAHRPRSRLELERYLRGKGYDSPVVAHITEECADLGHLDDAGFALAFVRDRIRLRPRAVWQLEAELRQRGVERRLATETVRRVLAEEAVTERALLEGVARRRWDRLSGIEPRVARRRLEAYLRRRGFPAAEIGDVVRELAESPARLEDRGHDPDH